MNCRISDKNKNELQGQIKNVQIEKIFFKIKISILYIRKLKTEGDKL